MNAEATIVWVLMAVAWALLALDLYHIVTVPALGSERGMARLGALISAFALALVIWLLMGLVLWSQQVPMGWLVWLATAVAAVFAIVRLDEGENPWPAPIPLALPILILVAAPTRFWPLAQVLLIVASVICSVWGALTMNAKSREYKAYRRALEQQQRAENLELVAAMSEETPLGDFRRLWYSDSDVRKEAIAAMRQLKRRQADVEELLAREDGVMIEDVIPELDLELTPRLEELLNARCVKVAEYARTFPGGGNNCVGGSFIFGPLPAMRWLKKKGGNPRPGVSEWKAAVLLYQDDERRRQLLSDLDALLK